MLSLIILILLIKIPHTGINMKLGYHGSLFMKQTLRLLQLTLKKYNSFRVVVFLNMGLELILDQFIPWISSLMKLISVVYKLKKVVAFIVKSLLVLWQCQIVSLTIIPLNTMEEPSIFKDNQNQLNLISKIQSLTLFSLKILLVAMVVALSYIQLIYTCTILML